MASAMQANCSEIEASANTIRELADVYRTAYEEIFVQFRRVDQVWDGEDNEIYNEKVISFEKDFIEMTYFFERVIQHLKLTADMYKTVESSVAVDADSLNRLTKKSGGSSSSNGSGGGGGSAWGGTSSSGGNGGGGGFRW